MSWTSGISTDWLQGCPGPRIRNTSIRGARPGTQGTWRPFEPDFSELRTGVLAWDDRLDNAGDPRGGGGGGSGGEVGGTTTRRPGGQRRRGPDRGQGSRKAGDNALNRDGNRARARTLSVGGVRDPGTTTPGARKQASECFVTAVGNRERPEAPARDAVNCGKSSGLRGGRATEGRREDGRKHDGAVGRRKNKI